MAKEDPIADEMLIAVYELAKPMGESPVELTKKFWEAFPAFANKYLSGVIDFNTDGEVITMKFRI